MRFRKSLLLFVSALVIAAISSPVNAWAQAKKIKVGYSSDAPGSLATWLARDTGIFAKNGLDVELVRTLSASWLCFPASWILSRLPVPSLSKAI